MKARATDVYESEEREYREHRERKQDGCVCHSVLERPIFILVEWPTFTLEWLSLAASVPFRSRGFKEGFI